MRHFISALFIFLLPIDCVSSHSASLVVAAEDAAIPWSYSDGTGYANEVVREAFRAVGIDVTFKVVPYARCKHLVIGGDIVACFSMSPEKGLKEKVALAEQPLFNVNYDYFHNRQKPLTAKKEDEIPRGTVVGIVTGYEYPDSAMLLKSKGVIFQESKDEETNLKKLILGRIDAAIINQNDLKPAAVMIEKSGAKGSVKFVLRSGTMGSYIGFSKTHPQGEFAREQFNKGFRIIQRNGTLKRIASRWMKRGKGN